MIFVLGEVFKEIWIVILDDDIIECWVEKFWVVIISDYEGVYFCLDGLCLGNIRLEFVVMVIIIEDELISLFEIDSGFILNVDFLV